MQYVNSESNNYGFTIIEVAIVLVVIISITMVTAKFFFKDYGAELADQTITEIDLIKQNAITYYAINGHWPGQGVGDDCSDASTHLGAISGLDSSDPYESQWYGDSGVINYETSCSPVPANAAFSVSLTLVNEDDKKWVNYILTKLPLTESDSSGMKIQAWIPAPSGVAAMQNIFSRKKTDPETEGEPSLNDMEAAINLNGNLINDYIIGGDERYKIGLSGGSVLSNLMLIPNNNYNCEHDWANAVDDTCFTLDLCPNDEKCHSPAKNHQGDRESPLGSVKANDIYIKASKKYLSEAKSKLLWIHKKSYYDMRDTELSSYYYSGYYRNGEPKACNPEHEQYEEYYKYICSIRRPECGRGYSPKIIVKPKIINANTTYYSGARKYRNVFYYIEYPNTDEWNLLLSRNYQSGSFYQWDNISVVNIDTYCVKD